MTSRRFLLDSTICIYHLNGASAELATKLVDRLDEVAVSSVTYAEVMLGAVRNRGAEHAAARRFFRQIDVLPFDRSAADAYAGLPFRRNRFDRLIAAHALALGATLVTADAADFTDVPGLSFENWTQ